MNPLQVVLTNTFTDKGLEYRIPFSFAAYHADISGIGFKCLSENLSIAIMIRGDDDDVTARGDVQSFKCLYKIFRNNNIRR